jgi:hypothetical protein
LKRVVVGLWYVDDAVARRAQAGRPLQTKEHDGGFARIPFVGPSLSEWYPEHSAWKLQSWWVWHLKMMGMGVTDEMQCGVARARSL